MKKPDYVGTADIAQMLGLNREYVTDILTKRMDFPPPTLRLSQKIVRWDRADVLGWIEKQRIQAQGKRPRSTGRK